MPTSPSPPDYRPDIDGLRAVAVLLVVLFHLKVKPVTGGFVGVDVFFVISGFLITRILVHEARTAGGISLSRFYARRARRLLPALFGTITFTAIGAFLLFTPEELARFGASMLFALLNLANVYFWAGTGYFDADAATKPLLHLWSIGVEEQFYAVWPLLLALLLTRSTRVVAISLVAVGAASLGLNGWFLRGQAVPTLTAALPALADWMRDGPATVFYLMPFRIFEFVIGALMVWLVAIRPRRPVALEPLLAAGLGLIVYAAFTYTEDTVFPYLKALVPCLGAALIIYAGRAPVTGWVLRNSAAAGLGLISYSIYLLHWPLIVLFGAYTTVAPASALEKGGVLLATLCGAAAMYRCVERPFRSGTASRWTPRTTLGAGVAAAILLALPAASAWMGDGWSWRLPASRIARSDADWRALEEAYCSRWDPSLPRALVTCQHDRGVSTNIFLWGDSHARHLIAGFSEAYRGSNIHVLYRSGCEPPSGFAGYVNVVSDTAQCVAHNRDALEFLLRQPPSTIVLTSAKRDAPEDVVAPLTYLLQRLRDAGHQAIVLGDFIRPGKSMIRCRNVPDWLVPDSALGSRCVPDAAIVDREMRYGARLISLLPEVVDVRRAQCPMNTCAFHADDGTPYFRDAHHLTTAGAIRLIARLREVLPIAAAAAAGSPPQHPVE